MPKRGYVGVSTGKFHSANGAVNNHIVAARSGAGCCHVVFRNALARGVPEGRYNYSFYFGLVLIEVFTATFASALIVRYVAFRRAGRSNCRYQFAVIVTECRYNYSFYFAMLSIEVFPTTFALIIRYVTGFFAGGCKCLY